MSDKINRAGLSAPSSADAVAHPENLSESEVRTAQSWRLRLLRRLVNARQAKPAEIAGVSYHSWSRMETAETGIDALALFRFCEYYELPSHYVICGRLDGVAPEIVALIKAAEILAAIDQPPGSPARAGRPTDHNLVGALGTRGREAARARRQGRAAEEEEERPARRENGDRFLAAPVS